MSIYSGFSTRKQEYEYNLNLDQIISLMCTRTIQNINKEPIDEAQFKNIFERLFISLQQQEQHQYLYPQFSQTLFSVADVLEIKRNGPSTKAFVHSDQKFFFHKQILSKFLTGLQNQTNAKPLSQRPISQENQILNSSKIGFGQGVHGSINSISHLHHHEIHMNQQNSLENIPEMTRYKKPNNYNLQEQYQDISNKNNSHSPEPARDQRSNVSKKASVNNSFSHFKNQLDSLKKTDLYTRRRQNSSISQRVSQNNSEQRINQGFLFLQQQQQNQVQYQNLRTGLPNHPNFQYSPNAQVNTLPERQTQINNNNNRESIINEFSNQAIEHYEQNSNNNNAAVFSQTRSINQSQFKNESSQQQNNQLNNSILNSNSKDSINHNNSSINGQFFYPNQNVANFINNNNFNNQNNNSSSINAHQGQNYINRNEIMNATIDPIYFNRYSQHLTSNNTLNQSGGAGGGGGGDFSTGAYYQIIPSTSLKKNRKRRFNKNASKDISPANRSQNQILPQLQQPSNLNEINFSSITLQNGLKKLPSQQRNISLNEYQVVQATHQNFDSYFIFFQRPVNHIFHFEPHTTKQSPYSIY